MFLMQSSKTPTFSTSNQTWLENLPFVDDFPLTAPCIEIFPKRPGDFALPCSIAMLAKGHGSFQLGDVSKDWPLAAVHKHTHTCI